MRWHQSFHTQDLNRAKVEFEKQSAGPVKCGLPGGCQDLCSLGDKVKALETAEEAINRPTMQRP